MEQYGYEMSFEAGRCGHGLGLLSTEPPHIAPYDHTMLEPGMVINIEPGVVSEHGVFCVEENVLVTETGYEILSGASRELYVVQS
ncbi:MAG: M24 family metallopeptidase [Bacillota bacterium]